MTYTVLINSDLKNSGSISDCKYYFDWDIFEQKKYKVYVQFVSSSLTSDYTKVPSLYIELGQGKSYSVNKTLIIAQNSQFFCQLYKVEGKTLPYLVSDETKHIELSTPPRNKDFTVRILNDDGLEFISDTDFSYTIKLTFEHI
jgi:hypothetical protein